MCNISAYNNFLSGYEAVKAQFNGLQELSTRSDVRMTVIGRIIGSEASCIRVPRFMPSLFTCYILFRHAPISVCCVVCYGRHSVCIPCRSRNARMEYPRHSGRKGRSLPNPSRHFILYIASAHGNISLYDKN